ncbi:MAG: hypothetical protein SPI30_00710 [Prevotella sp.]|nr:hypothetical protein [Prevotella sp.]
MSGCQADCPSFSPKAYRLCYGKTVEKLPTNEQRQPGSDISSEEGSMGGLMTDWG